MTFISFEKMGEVHLSSKVMKTLVAVFLVLTFLIMFSPTVCAEWWDNNWPYRRAITISGSHPENYQLKIILPFFDNSIRFTENESGPLLPYWVENWTSDNMTVWVRRYQANGTDNIIYVYYGNPNATSASNGDDTFIFFDDFSGTSLDSSKWVTFSLGNPVYGAWGSATVSNGILQIRSGYCTGGNYTMEQVVESKIKFQMPNIAVEARICNPNWGGTGSAGYYRSAGWGLRSRATDGTWSNYGFWLHSDEGGHKLDHNSSADTTWTGSEDKSSVDKPNSWAVRTVYVGSSVGWLRDYVLVYNNASDVPNTAENLAFNTANWNSIYPQGSLDVDWVRVRKYVSPEPTTSIKAEPPIATNLLTENQTNPTRMATFTPRFSITCLLVNKDYYGENLQIQVASENAFSSLLWDILENCSPPVENNGNVTITYSGSPLSRGVTYYWRARWYSEGVPGDWSYATFRIADMQITSVGADSTLIDRKRDWNARDNVMISIRIREEEGADAPLTCKLSVRDARKNILLENLILVDKSILDGENVIYTYIYNPPDDLPDDTLGPFEVRIIAEDNLGSRLADWTQMFILNDIRVSTSLVDNTPIYKIELSGNAIRVYDNVSTTLDNVVIIDNNEGEIQAIFSENSFSVTYGLVSPVRLRHGDWGRICVVVQDDALDGVSPILTYQVEGDNLRILNPIPTRYADRTEVVFNAQWASDGASVGYGTICLSDNSQISCQVSNGSGTLIIPHSARANSSPNKKLTCPDDADRPIWAILSQSFPFNILPWAEDLRADNRTLPARVTASPVFSWAFRDNNPNDSQLAFRIQVGSTPDNNDVWDYTGSGSANSVAYPTALARGQTYYVRVIVEDSYGEWQNADNENKWSTSWFKVNQLPVVTDLLIDGQTNPSASSLCPIFSWVFSDEDGDVQSHYEIWVGTSLGAGDVWNSSQLASSSNSVTYGGPPLMSGRTYYVQVRVRDGLEWSDWVRGSFTTSSSAPPTALQLTFQAQVSQQMTRVENIDNTPPELTWVVSNPEGETLYLVFECWDNSGISSVEAWVDNETVEVIINGKRVEVKAENLEEELHTVLIRVADVCGNENIVLLNYEIRRPRALPPVISTMVLSGSSLRIEVLNRENREVILEAHLYLDGRLFKVLPITLRPLEHSWVEVEMENLEPGNHEVVLRDAKGNLLGIRSLSILPAVADFTSVPSEGTSLTFWVRFSSAIGVGLVGLRIFTRRRRKAPPTIKTEEIPEVVRSLAPLLKREKND